MKWAQQASKALAGKLENGLAYTKTEGHVWFEDWWMVASLCDE
jgi:hypothetical protein